MMSRLTTQYVRPDSIPAHMGGDGEVPDTRLGDVLKLLESAPLSSVGSILDVGTGKGQVARFLAGQGMEVVGTGLEFASYGITPDAFRTAHGVELVECSVEHMPFIDGRFDAVVMSHVLEHCSNIDLALKEVHRVLRDDGWLFVFVPPYTDYVCAGHVNTGWNVGQLLYVLLLNGFDAHEGRFVEYRESVCAFVRKSTAPLPQLRGDRGDIRILADNGLLPLPMVHNQPTPQFMPARNQASLVSADAFDDGFWGHVAAIGWDFGDLPQERLRLPRRLLKTLGRIMPRRLRDGLISVLRRVANSL